MTSPPLSLFLKSVHTLHMTHVAVASPGTLTATSSRTRQGHLHGVHRYLKHQMSVEITESNSSARALNACIQGNV